MGCNFLAGSRAHTWSSFIGSAFTGPSKANKHRRNRLQRALIDTGGDLTARLQGEGNIMVWIPGAGLLVRAAGWYMGQRQLYENANIMGGLEAKQTAWVENPRKYATPAVNQ